MTESTGSLVSAAVFSADPELSQYIQLLLERSQQCTFELSGAWHLSEMSNPKEHAVILLAVGQSEPPEGEYELISNALIQFKQHHPDSQIILLIGQQLPLQYSCRFVSIGITAIVNYRQNDCIGILNDHVHAANQHYLDLKTRVTRYSIAQASNNGLVGNSLSLLKVMKKAQRAAQVSDAPVIIYGESGTGKQLIAEYIHHMDDKRKDNPFISVNCSAIAGTLAESELFGHKKGAFTGATKDRLGYFRAAQGGTILLDEVSELEPSLQPKILRVLQENLVLPVGSDQEYEVDVRVIAATNRDLKSMVEQNKFRLDLYQRLNVIHLSVPPLRQRIKDLPLLFQTFLKKYRHYYQGEITSVDPQVYEVLVKSVGRGNIRELENIVRQMLVFKEHGSRIELTDLPSDVIQAGLGPKDSELQVDIADDVIESLINGSKQLSDAVDEFEKMMLMRLINRGVNQSALADRLGITRRTLYNKLQKHNIR